MNVLEKIEAFISSYVSFEMPGLSLPVALWVIGTHCFQRFDAFPYVVITSTTKRSGKTRLSEVVGFCSQKTMNFSAMTPSTLFRCINPRFAYEEKDFLAPTIIFDEAESLSSEAANTMRSVLNAGYRKGQVIPRTVGQDVVEFKVYCPKIFILIGDVYDTLRDRSIIVTMRRGEPTRRFLFDDAKLDGINLQKLITDNISKCPSVMEQIDTHYRADRAQFLSDRDEEIWSPLFAICKTLAPARYRELQRIAVDLCALKTADKQIHRNMNLFEEQAQQIEYAERALVDLLAVINGDKSIFSDEAVTKMRDLDLSPWRTFRGKGLEANNLADLVAGFGVHPVVIRKGGRNGEVRRGYRKIDVEEAVDRLQHK